MENVTHALAGLLVAEAALQWKARQWKARQEPAMRPMARLAYVVAALSSNVPDADLLYKSITPGKLGYLLHHRGHTHTLIVAIALGLAIAYVATRFARWQGIALDRGGARILYGLGAFGPALHIAMDGWNNYGVHPFWPIYSGWFYGDTIFIVEPFFWIVAIPPLIALGQSRVWRAVLGLLLVAMLALVWMAHEMVPLAMRVTLLVVALVVSIATFVMGRGAPPLRAGVRRLTLAIACWAMVLAVFTLSSSLARSIVVRRLAAEVAGQTRDVALTPMPANPLCWSAIAVLTTPEGDFTLRYSLVAPFPALMSASACPGNTFARGTTAPRHAVDGIADPRVIDLGEFRAPLADLRSLAARRCDVAAAMRFLRVPFYVREEGRLVIGDARFDRDEAIDFSDVVLPPDDGAPVACPRFVPPWRPPRSDLIDGAAP